MSYQTRRAERIRKIVSEVCKRIDKDIFYEAATPGLKLGIDDLARISNPSALKKLATKVDINIVPGKLKLSETPLEETLTDVSNDIIVKDRKVYVSVEGFNPDEAVEFTTPKGLTYTAIVAIAPGNTSQDVYILKDIKLKKDTVNNLTPEEKEEKQVESTQQENAVFNLKNWAIQLQVEIGEGVQAPNSAIKFTYFSEGKNNPIIILVLSNGLVKMSGHNVADFSDFSNIIKWHQSNT